MLVFLHASDNNRKETVALYFTEAARSYGLPSRIRVDHGGENNTICEIMNQLRGQGRASFIRGSSVHNQRIERSWRDLWYNVNNLYYEIFSFLEESGNCDVETDVWALHYSFLPRIQRDLDEFVASWNIHPIRTASSSTPMQLFVERSFELNLMNIESIMGGVHQIIDNNWTTSNQVVIPAIQCPITEDEVVELQSLVDPLSDDQDKLGIANYVQVKEFLAAHSTSHIV